ncbi:hypothetical protein [Streptomyces sp. NPDC054865]
MTIAISRYVARDEPEVVRHAAWLLCRWLTDHPAGADLSEIYAHRYFHDRRDHTTGALVTPDILAAAVRTLVDERRVIDEAGTYRLRPELREPLNVTTVEWPGPVVAGFKRKRYTMRLSLCPSGWPLAQPRAGYPGHEVCGSVFDRVRDPRGLCDDLPVWRVSRSDGRMTSMQYWCDAELPSDYQAEAAGLSGAHR